eukprot:CAMPEP_0168472598 /NCGR_PEP_ID=MMETSP0228-20121227/59883_1 /TAXON_ID=133427 /ORGANISM="Protoceratium reticulatum, Strain CCCM 535 (=CCMP 1889)" /LENGTH=45 /DNA_ID= /DNA_START= /DNA_END= /DNA_ORIENTATION=
MPKDGNLALSLYPRWSALRRASSAMASGPGSAPPKLPGPYWRSLA